jgi:hypothetical protein
LSTHLPHRWLRRKQDFPRNRPIGRFRAWRERVILLRSIIYSVNINFPRSGHMCMHCAHVQYNQLLNNKGELKPDIWYLLIMMHYLVVITFSGTVGDYFVYFER